MEWEIRNISAKGPGKERFHLQDEQEMTSLLDTYFPKYDNELSTLPHLSRIRRKYFFPGQVVEEKGKLVETKDDAYDGEIMQVLGCLGEIETLTGLAFHSYNQDSASLTFSNVKGKFEIDWILVNNAGIFVIEVGLASDVSNPEPIINSKVDQVIKRTSEIISSLIKAANKAHLLENEIKYVVALPNVSIKDVESWLEDEDHRTQLENFDSNICFFTQETMIQRKIFKGRFLEEINLTEVFSHYQHQTDFKQIAALLMHGKLSTRTPDRRIPKQKPCERAAAVKMLDNFEYPEELVLSPEQQFILYDIISGNHPLSMLFGDAGSGKTTVLQLILLFHAGKSVSKPIKVIFYVPEDKWAFTLEMERFIEKYCDQNFVQIVRMEQQLGEIVQTQRRPALFLVDEIYGSAFNNWYRNIVLDRPNIFPVQMRLIVSIVTSGVEWHIGLPNQLFDDISNYFLKIAFRNSLHISRPAAKIKRSVDAENDVLISCLSNARSFAVFYSKVEEFTVSFKFFEESGTIDQDLILIYGNQIRVEAKPTSTVIRVAPECDIQYLGFTGIEAVTVAIVLQPELFGTSKLSDKQRLFLYNALTRARLHVVFLSSPDVIKLLQRELHIDEQERVLEKIQEGATLSQNVLGDCFEKFDEKRREQFLISIAMSGNIQLVKNFLHHIRAQPHQCDDYLAAILSYSFCQQQVSESFLKFVKGLVDLFCFWPYVHRPITLLAFYKLFIHKEIFRRFHSLMDLPEVLAAVGKLENEQFTHGFIVSASYYGQTDLVQLALKDGLFEEHLLLQCLIIEASRNSCHLIEALASKLKPFEAVQSKWSLLAWVSFICPQPSFASTNCKEAKSSHAIFYTLDVLYDLLSDTPCDENGNTLLHSSCRYSNSYFVGKVIERNATHLAAKNNDLKTPIDIALELEKFDILYFLIENYWKELSVVESYRPLSMILVALGLTDKFKKLLSEQPKQLYKEARNGFNIMHAACGYGRVDVLEFILSDYPEAASKTPSADQFLPIVCACICGHLAIVERLLKFDNELLYVRSSEKNATLLHFAARGGFTKVAEYLLEEDKRSELITSQDEDGNTPLANACGENKVEMVKLLCEWKPEMLNEEVLIRAIQIASMTSQASIVLYLLRRFADIVGKARCEAEMVEFFLLSCFGGKLTTIREFYRFHSRSLSSLFSPFNKPLIRACSAGRRLAVVKFFLHDCPHSQENVVFDVYLALKLVVNNQSHVFHYLNDFLDSSKKSQPVFCAFLPIFFHGLRLKSFINEYRENSIFRGAAYIIFSLLFIWIMHFCSSFIHTLAGFSPWGPYP